LIDLPTEGEVKQEKHHFCTEVLYPETAMSQINLHTTVEFEIDLLALMMAAGIRTKSQAIRHAVHMLAAAYARRAPSEAELGTAPGNPGGARAS
jgi:hypothetical protein